MSSPLNPLTALDAVNMMLSSIGQAPVNSLDVTGIRDVSIAKLSLDNTTREVLTAGWSFNQDYSYPLAADGEGRIPVPAGALSVDPTDPHLDYVVRYIEGAPYLYDREKRTFEIGKAVDVDVVWAMEFEQLPQAARGYIATRAARLFQANVIGSDILFRFTEQHELEAKAILHKRENRTKDRNMLRSPTSTNAIFHRRFNPR